ncbi:hypothetical protein [uncultured Methylovirgula sp.]|uniref:hypothetical protein n=1 Tax=uncultured Methylovirgula sp. TaxID=1285960 RepID=UPI0026244D49|nr:hypothetical protein [uncultured Methylovirgula sp.]
MLRGRSKLASLALAGALTTAFGSAALAQDWSNSPETDISYRIHHRYYGPHAYGYGYAPYGYYDGYYRDGYYDAGPLGLGGAIVGSALGIADTAATVATGYPYGYYHAYGYGPYGSWGPYGGYGYW